MAQPKKKMDTKPAPKKEDNGIIRLTKEQMKNLSVLSPQEIESIKYDPQHPGNTHLKFVDNGNGKGHLVVVADDGVEPGEYYWTKHSFLMHITWQTKLAEKE